MRTNFMDCGRAVMGSLGLALAAGFAHAQPLDAYIFKAAHNSYERDEPLSYQVNVLNCWGVELDLCWSSSQDRPTVRHGCGLPTHGTLEELLHELTEDAQIFARVTFIHFDMNEFDCSFPQSSCEDWTWDRVHAVINVIDSIIPRSMVYTVRDLENDGNLWPSPQQLRLRGKHFIPVVTRGCSWDAYNYFHHSAEREAVVSCGQDMDGRSAPTTTSINRGSASLPSGEEPAPDDRFIWRSYPSFEKESSEDLDRDHWEDAVDHGFNIAACNYIDRDWTARRFTIPSMPMYVDAGWDPQGVPIFGTVYRPYTTLRGAITRVEQVNTSGIARTEPYPFILSGNTTSNYHIGTAPVDPGVPIEIRPNQFRTILIRP